MTIRAALRGVMAAALIIGCSWAAGQEARAGVPAVSPPASAVAPSSPSNSSASAQTARGDDGQDIRDIHGPVPLQRRLPTAWLAAGALAAGALAAGLLYRRRHRPPLPPHRRALRAMEELRALPGAEPRAFSFALSEIVRTYVESSFSLPAVHRTTEEFLAALMSDQSPVAAHRATLGAFLQHCDLAKFAGWSLTPADMTALLDSAVAFVQATSPSGATTRPDVATPASEETVLA